MQYKRFIQLFIIMSILISVYFSYSNINKVRSYITYVRIIITCMHVVLILLNNDVIYLYLYTSTARISHIATDNELAT